MQNVVSEISRWPLFYICEGNGDGKIEHSSVAERARHNSYNHPLQFPFIILNPYKDYIQIYPILLPIQ